MIDQRVHLVTVFKLIHHPKRRAFPGFVIPLVVKTGGSDIGVSQPGLHLGDIGFVFEGVGGGGRPQGVNAEAGEVDVRFPTIIKNNLVERIRMHRLAERAGLVVFEWAKEWAVEILPVTGDL